MNIIETDVTIIGNDELTYEGKNLDVNDITVYHVNDRDIIRKSNVLIVQKGNNYKLLKCRYTY